MELEGILAQFEEVISVQLFFLWTRTYDKD